MQLNILQHVCISRVGLLVPHRVPSQVADRGTSLRYEEMKYPGWTKTSTAASVPEWLAESKLTNLSGKRGVLPAIWRNLKQKEMVLRWVVQLLNPTPLWSASWNLGEAKIRS